MYSLAPALAAGNTVVVKPSEHASASVLETLRLAPRGRLPARRDQRRHRRAARRASALVDHPAVAQDLLHRQRDDRRA